MGTLGFDRPSWGDDDGGLGGGAAGTAPGKRSLTQHFAPRFATIAAAAPEAALAMASSADRSDSIGDVAVFRGPATQGALGDLGVRGAAVGGRAFVGDGDPAVLAHEVAHARGADEAGADRAARHGLDAALPWIGPASDVAQFWGGRTNAAAVSLRPSPDLTPGTFPQLALGVQVEVLEERPDWLRVRAADGREGWIPRRNITRDAAAAMDAGVAAPPTSTMDGGVAAPPTSTMDGGVAAPPQHTDGGGGPPPAPTPDLATRYRDAVAAANWHDVAFTLANYNDDDIRTRLRALTPAQRLSLYTVAVAMGGPSEPRFIALLPPIDLEAAFRGAAAAHRWEQAAIHLNGFNDADITTRVASLSVPDRTAMLAATPAWDHRVRAALLEAAYTAARTAGQWVDAARALGGFNRTDIETHVRALSPADLATLDTGARTAFPDDGHMLRRVISFVIAAPPARPAEASLGPIANRGHETTTAVPGGNAVVGTEMGGGPLLHDDSFSMSYQGTDAANTGWIQFISIEIQSFDAAGHSLGFETTPGLPAPGGFTIDASPPAARRWYLDSVGASAPFYESPTSTGPGFVHTTAPDRTEIYDWPSSDPDVVRPIFARPNVARVVEREHFNDYLVRGMDVLFRAALYVEFTWTSAPAVGAGDPVRTLVRQGEAAAGAVTNDQHRALVARHPNYRFIPHH